MFGDLSLQAVKPLRNSLLMKLNSMSGNIITVPLDDSVNSPVRVLNLSGFTSAVCSGGVPNREDLDSDLSFLFNQATAQINLNSTQLDAAINRNEGAIIVPIKMLNSGIWTNGLTASLVRFLINGTNFIIISKSSAANLLSFDINFGGVSKGVTFSTNSVEWLLLVLTWNKTLDTFKAYVNSVQAGVTQSGLGTLSASAFTQNVIYGRTIEPLKGYGKCFAVFNRELTYEEIGNLTPLIS